MRLRGYFKRCLSLQTFLVGHRYSLPARPMAIPIQPGDAMMKLSDLIPIILLGSPSSQIFLEMYRTFPHSWNEQWTHAWRKPGNAWSEGQVKVWVYHPGQNTLKVLTSFTEVKWLERDNKGEKVCSTGEFVNRCVFWDVLKSCILLTLSIPILSHLITKN